MDEKEVKRVVDSSPKILKFPAMDEKIRMTLMGTDLFNITQTEQNILFESPISLNNWDTATIVRADKLNEEIEKKKTYPLEIGYQVQDKETEDIYSINGLFLPWQITPGGDGRNLWFKISFKNGSFQIGENQVDLQDVSLTVSVSLAYFPRPEKEAEDGSYRLSINTSMNHTEEDCVIVLSVEAENMTDIRKTEFASVMRCWLNLEKTLSMFQPLFATVVIDNNSSADFKWLKPTYMSYAYRDAPNIEDALFGVLCMTNERDGSEGISQMPLVAMKSNEDILFLVNREIFVKYQYIESLTQAIPGTTDDNFVLGDDSLSVEAKNIPLATIKYGAIDYQPIMKNFHVYFEETRVRTELQVDINISPGIDVHSYIETQHSLVLGQNAEGEPTMIFKNIGEPIVYNETETASWIVITEAIVDVIIGVASAAIVETVKEVTQKVIISIVAALTAAVVGIVIHEIIATIVADGTLEKLPSITPMLEAGVSPVKWPFTDSSIFEVENISYNGSFIFRGKLV